MTIRFTNNGYFQAELDTYLVAKVLIGIIERLTLTKLFLGVKTPEELASEIVHLLLNGMLPKIE